MEHDALTLHNNTVASTLLQSRAMLWYNKQLVVSNRDFLFYDVESDGGLKLARNISVDAPAFWDDEKQGTNGMMVGTDSQGTTLLVGAAMPGMLVAVSLQRHGSGAPQAFGYRNGAAFGLGGIYDIDGYHPGARAPHPTQGVPPLAVVVSPAKHKSQAILGVIQMHDATTSAFLPTTQWKQLGSVSFDQVVRSAGTNVTTGCNRVRVHQASARVVFSCFGSKREHGVSWLHSVLHALHPVCRLTPTCFDAQDIVGFVDLADPSNPVLISTMPFVSQQPTGMLVVGDALFGPCLWPTLCPCLADSPTRLQLPASTI